MSLLSIVRGLEMLGRCRSFSGQRVPITELLADATALFRMEELADGVQITVEVTAPQLSVRGDPMQLRQLLVNLMRNAAQAMGSCVGARLGLEAEASDRCIVIRIRDEGPGVGESERELIFMPFYGGRKKGSGLGLAICRAIVQAHLGQISVHNHREGGAVFVIRIPEFVD